MVAAEGFSGIRNFLYDRGLAMARPRNVLIVGIMLAIIEGFGKIYLAGADHSWSKTLWVDDENRVMSRQPHFYKDNDEEHRRVDTTYAHIRLHKIYESFAIAFKSYFVIKEYAEKRGVEVINITPGSFIDAFERRKAEELNK